MSLFYITEYPNEPDNSLKGCYSSRLYGLLETSERLEEYDKRGLGGVFVADVMNVAELDDNDFMWVYNDIKSVKIPDNRPDLHKDWQEIDKLFKSDPRFS